MIRPFAAFGLGVAAGVLSAAGTGDAFAQPGCVFDRRMVNVNAVTGATEPEGDARGDEPVRRLGWEGFDAAVPFPYELGKTLRARLADGELRIAAASTGEVLASSAEAGYLERMFLDLDGLHLLIMHAYDGLSSTVYGIDAVSGAIRWRTEQPALVVAAAAAGDRLFTVEVAGDDVDLAVRKPTTGVAVARHHALRFTNGSHRDFSDARLRVISPALLQVEATMCVY